MRVIVADDSGLYRDLLVRELTDAGHEVVDQTGDADDVVAMVDRQPPDVVLLDIRMPPTHTDDGLRSALLIRQRWPDVGVVLLSNHGEVEYAIRLFHSVRDRAGYLLKERASSAEELLDTIQRVANGEVVVDPHIVARLLARPRPDDPLRELTERELQALTMMAQGRANRTIASTMNVSLSTVEKHLMAVFRKLRLPVSNANAQDNARVMAVLTYLRHTGQLRTGSGFDPLT